MSARSSTVFPGPRWVPATMAVTPVRAIAVRGSSPSARSRSATRPEVRRSSNASSGCACRSRRVSTIARISSGVRLAAGVIAAVLAASLVAPAVLETPPLALALQHVLVQDDELDAPVPRHRLGRDVRHDRPGRTVALRDEVATRERRERLQQIAPDRLRPVLAELLVRLRRALVVG